MRMYFVQMTIFFFVANLEYKILLRQEKYLEVLLNFRAVLCF